jgi:hypothetical protein
VARTATDGNGTFGAFFNVPEVASGPHTVAATDGQNSASATFTVTSGVTSGASPTTNQQQSAAVQGMLPF